METRAYQNCLLYGLIAVLFLAPIPFGSVQPGWTALLEAVCLVLGILWVVWRVRRGFSPLPWRDPILLGGALILLLGGAQLVPLPRPVLERVSPRAVELREQFEPKAGWSGETQVERGTGEGIMRPVSLYPWATRRAMIRFLVYLLVALISLDLARHGTARRAMVYALAASGGFQALYGLSEFFSGRQHILGYPKKYYTDVATGTFINRNHFAGYLEMTMPLAIVLAVTALTPLLSGPRGNLRRRLAGASGKEVFRASALLILALTMAIALVCSRSRMGIASSLMALLSVGLFLAWRGRGKSFVVSVAIVAGATFLLFSQGGGGPVWERFLGTAEELRGGMGRWSIWAQVGQMIFSFPIFGVGLGVFPYVFPFFRSTGEGAGVAHAHNDFLEFAAEVGVVGCVVVILSLLLVVRSILQRLSGRPDFGFLGYGALAGMLAIGFHSITDFNLAIPSNALTLAVLFGTLICWVRFPAPALADASVRRPPRGARTWIPAVFLPALLLPMFVPVVSDLKSWTDRGGGRFLGKPPSRPVGWDGMKFFPGNGSDAERMFRAAAEMGDAAIADLQTLLQAQGEEIQPSLLGLSYVEQRLSDAIQLQMDALRQLPTSSEGHILLGHLFGAHCSAIRLSGIKREGCLLEATRELRSALVLNPMGAKIHARVARFLIQNWTRLGEEDRAAAREIIRQAISMNRKDRNLQKEVALLARSWEENLWDPPWKTD